MTDCKPETIGARAAWQWSTTGLALLGEALSNFSERLFSRTEILGEDH